MTNRKKEDILEDMKRYRRRQAIIDDIIVPLSLILLVIGIILGVIFFMIWAATGPLNPIFTYLWLGIAGAIFVVGAVLLVYSLVFSDIENDEECRLYRKLLEADGIKVEDTPEMNKTIMAVARVAEKVYRDKMEKESQDSESKQDQTETSES